MTPNARHKLPLVWIWVGLTTLAASWLSYAMFGGGPQRRIFLPGKTSDGHYQIELRCEVCHENAFAWPEELQIACERCHEEELNRAKDSHPRAKFSDPRNAERVAKLDARFCVTCHREHVEDATLEGGLTLPRDYCIACHADIAEERPSHRDLAFSRCNDAGCHNFHDNRALYEDFLASRAVEADLLPAAAISPGPRQARNPPLTTADGDLLPELGLGPVQLADWARSAHGRAGINCSDCHGRGSTRVDASTSPQSCEKCHRPQVHTWQDGKHGIRTARGMTPMRPDQARASMRAEAGGRLLSCEACHGAHSYDARAGAVDACLGCHSDEHSRAYAGSRHATLFRAELLGLAPVGSGVSCATCHMPREPADDGGLVTQHNQNDNLQPNEKMIRGVCNQCHGLAFSIDALADEALIRGNFSGRPTTHVASLEMAKRRAGSALTKP